MRVNVMVLYANTLLVANAVIEVRCQGVRSDILEVLRSPLARSILLWLPTPDATDLRGWMSRFSFPVQLWTTFEDSQMRALKNYSEENTKVFVLVPHSPASLREGILTRLKKDIIYLSTVRWLFFLQSGARLPYEDYPEVSCLLIAVNPTGTLDVPVDGYRNCTHRKSSSPDILLPNRTKGSLSQLRGKSFLVANKILENDGTLFPPGSYDYPSSLVLTKILETLNVTVQSTFYRLSNSLPDQVCLDLMNKTFDLVVGPMETLERYRFVSVEAVVESVAVAVYSAGRSRLSPSTVEFIFTAGPLLLLLLCSAATILTVHATEARLWKHPSEHCNVFFFLLSAVLSRCQPFPTFCDLRLTTSLLVLWLFTMIGVSSYIQSALTSESSIPPLTSSVETVADLEMALSSGKVLPCVRKNDFSHKFIESSGTSVATRLRELIRLCKSSCISSLNGTECFRRSSAGTHVFVDVSLGIIDSWEALENRLVASEESLAYTYMSAQISKSFTYAVEMKHIARIAAQSGLTEFLKRREQIGYLHLLAASDETSPYSSLRDYLLAYLCGNLTGIVILVLEIIRKRLGTLLLFRECGGWPSDRFGATRSVSLPSRVRKCSRFVKRYSGSQHGPLRTKRMRILCST